MINYTHSQFCAALKKQNQLSPKDFSAVRFLTLPPYRINKELVWQTVTMDSVEYAGQNLLANLSEILILLNAVFGFAPSLNFMGRWMWISRINVLPAVSHYTVFSNFDVLLTVHLSIFISVFNQLDAQNFCFTISLFHASTCFEHMCSSSGDQNCITIHHTYRCDDTRGCVMQFWPPDDEHMC